MDDITFQITLPSGAVATNPAELASLRQLGEPAPGPIVTSDGRVLVPPAAPITQEDDGEGDPE